MDFPTIAMPPPPVLTPFHPDSLGLTFLGQTSTSATGPALGLTASTAWGTIGLARYYPFRLYSHAVAVQLLWFVGATSSGDIDVGIYTSHLNRIVSSGATAMSATVNTVQELNITDTPLPPGDYLLGAMCSSATGTCFGWSTTSDEIQLSTAPAYMQSSANPLPNPAVPVVDTGNPAIFVVGIQFASAF